MLQGSDCRVYATNFTAATSAGPSSATNISDHNTISNICGYQHDWQLGDVRLPGGHVRFRAMRDKITFNDISVNGYAPRNDTSAVVFPIDVQRAMRYRNPTVNHKPLTGPTLPKVQHREFWRAQISVCAAIFKRCSLQFPLPMRVPAPVV